MPDIIQPKIVEVSGGYRISCPLCTFGFNSLIPVASMVHLCADRKAVVFPATALKGQKTSPPSEAHLAVLAKKELAKKGARR